MKRLIFILAVLLLPLSAHAGTNTWATGNLDGWYTWESWGTADMNITLSPAQPDGNTKTLRITTPAGTTSDSGQQIAGATKLIDPTENELWHQFYLYYPDEYTFHPVAEKISAFDWPSNSNHNMLLVWQYGMLTMAPQLAWYGYVEFTPNSGHGPYQETGHWYKFVEHVVMNTAGVADGVYQLWVDDVLVMNYSNVPYRNTGDTEGFDAVKQLLVWGGQGGGITLDADMYQYRGTTIVSTDPIGGGGSDTNPPYPSQWSPAKNATNVAIASRTVTFHIEDSVDVLTAGGAVNVEGVAYACGDPELTCTGNGTTDVTVTYTNGSDWSNSQVVNISTGGFADTAGNVMTTDAWSFTTAPVSASGMSVVNGRYFADSDGTPLFLLGYQDYAMGSTYVNYNFKLDNVITAYSSYGLNYIRTLVSQAQYTATSDPPSTDGSTSRTPFLYVGGAVDPPSGRT
jgi:hypothetical protein